MRSTLSGISFALTAMILGCGRSQLPIARGSATSSASSGAGGSGGGGGSSSAGASSGSSGSGGGYPLFCPFPVLTGAPIGTLLDASHPQIHPALVLTPAGEPVALFGGDPFNAPVDTGIPILGAVASWGNWPLDLGTGFVASPRGGTAFVAAPSDSQGFALALNPMTAPPFTAVRLVPSVLPGKMNSSTGTVVAESFTGPLAPLFLARAPGHYLVGSVFPEGPGYRLDLTLTDAAGTVGSVSELSGCGNTPVVAAGVAVSDGFLAAFSSDRPVGQCNDGPFGLQDRIEVEHWMAAAPAEMKPGADLPTDGALQVELVPRAGGAWLIWQDAGASAEVFPPIQAVKLDVDGQMLDPPIALSPPGGSHAPFAATPMGDGFAVVWADSTDPSAPQMIVTLFSSEGKKLSQMSFTTAPEWLAKDRIALLASPYPDKLIVAWSTSPPAGGVSRLLVARIDCIIPD